MCSRSPQREREIGFDSWLRLGNRFRKLGKAFELFFCDARVYGTGRQRNGVAQMIGAPGGDEGSGGVEEDDIAARGFLAGQHFANQLGIQGGVSASDVIERGALPAELFGGDFVAANLSIAHLGDVGCGGDGDFVEAIASVNYEGAAKT